MANLGWKVMGLKLVGSTGITDISAYVNSQSLAAAISVLDQTGMGAANFSALNGLSKVTVAVNGWVNTTTDGMVGLWVNGGTGVAKRCDFIESATRHYTGTVLPSGVTYSGSPNTLQVFSANLEFTGAISRTSVALS
jgi:hypothetical protein